MDLCLASSKLQRNLTGPSFRMLDAQAARAELEAKGDPKEANIQKMLSAAAERLKDKTKALAVKVGARRQSESGHSRWFHDIVAGERALSVGHIRREQERIGQSVGARRLQTIISR